MFFAHQQLTNIKSKREGEVTHETKTIQLRHRKHTETSRRGPKIQTDTTPQTMAS